MVSLMSAKMRPYCVENSCKGDYISPTKTALKTADFEQSEIGEKSRTEYAAGITKNKTVQIRTAKRKAPVFGCFFVSAYLYFFDISVITINGIKARVKRAGIIIF
jgi:hypothetical protein